MITYRRQPHSTIRVRRTVTPAKLAANRANAKLGGRPPGSMSPIKCDLSERCRVKDMRHVEILEDIAENSTNEGYRLTAIQRDFLHRTKVWYFSVWEKKFLSPG
jgi:hypothetical protein